MKKLVIFIALLFLVSCTKIVYVPLMVKATLIRNPDYNKAVFYFDEPPPEYILVYDTLYTVDI